MLIATLPTLRRSADMALADQILGHPAIGAARYNTGGDAPYSPKEILQILKPIAQKHGKTLYVDLEGRQVRVARWTPFSRGAVVLNRDFEIELPAMVHFRRAGWFEVMGAIPEERKIFFVPPKARTEYYLGESQSIHVVARRFEVKGYLGGLDFEYTNAAVDLGIHHFMLSFVESAEDISEFYEAYRAYGGRRDLPEPKLVLKIESQNGIAFVKTFRPETSREFHLMAARDDLFLSFRNRREEILAALKLIVKRDPDAIVASRILSGLEATGEVTLADMEDIFLMDKFGYRNFMLSDELADSFPETMEAWQKVILPLTEKKRGIQWQQKRK